MSGLTGEGYDNSVFVVDESNVLIIGYDYRIIYVDISDPNNLIVLKVDTYGDAVSEPREFKLSSDKKLLVCANSTPNVMFIETN